MGSSDGEALEGLYAVAMLRIALELKQTGRPAEEIVRGVLARMRLPEEQFRDYLAQHLPQLEVHLSRR